MMTLALAFKLHHKYRKAIRVVQTHIKGGRTVTTEELMSTYGWSRSKAHDTLHTMNLLGILKQQKQKEHEPHGEAAVQGEMARTGSDGDSVHLE